MRFLCFVLVLVASAWIDVSGAEAQIGLPLTLAPSGQLRIDGSLREWRDLHFAEVGESAAGSMRIAFGYDSEALFVGAEVRDDRLERLGSVGPDDDAIVLTFAMPGRGGLVGTEVWLWPGRSGQSAAEAGVGAVGARTSRNPEIQVIEAPSRGGYTLEARIPWRAIRGGQRWEEGRASVRLHDADGRSVHEVELSAVDRAHLERMPELRPSQGGAATLDAFLSSQSLLGAQPSADLRGDVGGGDARPERVVVVDRFVVVFGPGWLEGQSYSFTRLPVASSADLRGASLVDLTGDGKAELTLQMTQRGDSLAREVWTVVSFAGSVGPVFMVETMRETANGRVESRLDVRRGGRGQIATIRVRAGSARGFDGSNFPELAVADAEPVMVPWGPVRERTYRWDGSRFAPASERENPEFRAVATTASAASSAPATQPAGPTPDQLLSAFRQRAGIRAGQPRFEATVNLAAGPDPERMEVYGQDLVVVGEGFRGGNQWFHYRIPVANPEDVREVRTADLTGDGRSEVLISATFASGDVRRTMFSVHQFTPDGFRTIFQREIGRTQRESGILNQVAVRGGALEIRSGTARGWSEATYPYRDEPGSDGVAAPLLPWRDAPLRCAYRGGELACAESR